MIVGTTSTDGASPPVASLLAVTTFERPAPDIDKIVAAWETWEEQGEDVLPGRTMADLKIGGLDRVLDTLLEQSEDIAPAAEAWNLWERGKVGPEDSIAALIEAGFAAIVEALAAAR